MFVSNMTDLKCLVFGFAFMIYSSNCVEKKFLTDSLDGYQPSLTAIEAKLRSMKAELESLKANQKTKSGGAIFIRWGRTVCPSNISETVYSGYAGGARQTESGGPAEYICLPPDPDLTEPDPHIQWEGNVWGAEFEGTIFAPDSYNKDVTCAVCRLTYATTQLMIPGKASCYNGWTRLYNGHLASGWPGHASASQYVCVDSSPEYLPKGDANLDGKLFYPVTAKCGSLLCPPYKDNYYLKCVVCAK